MDRIVISSKTTDSVRKYICIHTIPSPIFPTAMEGRIDRNPTFTRKSRRGASPILHISTRTVIRNVLSTIVLTIPLARTACIVMSRSPSKEVWTFIVGIAPATSYILPSSIPKNGLLPTATTCLLDVTVSTATQAPTTSCPRTTDLLTVSSPIEALPSKSRIPTTSDTFMLSLILFTCPSIMRRT